MDMKIHFNISWIRPTLKQLRTQLRRSIGF